MKTSQVLTLYANLASLSPNSITSAQNSKKTGVNARSYFPSLFANLFRISLLGVVLLSACEPKIDDFLPSATTLENVSKVPTPVGTPVPPVTPGTPVPPTVPTIEKAAFYIAPNGNDNNKGDITQPFATLTKAWTVIASGDLVYMRGGTYRFSSNVELNGKDGTAGNLTKIWAYPGEKPIIDYSHKTWAGGTFALNLYPSYLHLKGIRVTNMVQSSSPVHTGMRVVGSNTILENCEVDRIGGYGYKIDNNANNVLFLNCDAHHCGDPFNNYENGNGFNATTNSGTGHRFDGCRAWLNGDDGFDTYGANGYIEYNNCWSFKNGYFDNGTPTSGDGEGFKIGPNRNGIITTTLRKYTNCIAFDNYFRGFAQSAETLNTFETEIYNCFTFRNRSVGFSFDVVGVQNIVKNNVSYLDGASKNISTASLNTNNNWNGGVTVTYADFMSIDATGADGPRQSDGSLPNLQFLRLASGSDLINAGANVGIPYSGSAADLGPFEYSN